MTKQPSLPAEPTYCSQIRTSIRFPSDKPQTWVIVGDERKNATILNESFGGLGVTIEMSDAVDVRVGDTLIVQYCDYPTTGRVQWIERNQEAQQIRLGIQFVSP
jgi:hypothetical protein